MPGNMSKLQIIGEFVEFLWKQKKYWITPIVLILVLCGLLLVFAESSVIAPFIYTLF